MSFVRNVVVVGFFLLSCSPCFCQTAESKMFTHEEPYVQVRLSLTDATKEMLAFDLEVTNSGENPVYVVTDTVRTDGSRGPYVSMSNRDASTLQLEVRLFGPPPYNLYMNAARARLMLLRPGERNLKRVLIPLPILRTEPPYDRATVGKAISEKELSGVQAVVGVLPATSEIARLLESKSEPNVVNGLESVTNGESKMELYKAEGFSYSPIVPLLLKSSTGTPNALLHESGDVDPPE
jgi:hypothetical protein